MVKDDYLSSATGGSLRLKGAKDAGITKKKKKKPKPTSSPAERAGSAERRLTVEGEPRKHQPENSQSEEAAATAKERAVNPLQEVDVEEEESGPHVYKTESERRHEEMRRKRLDERLKREGVKTHKERVEELNRYLSNLSQESGRDNHCFSVELWKGMVTGDSKAIGLHSSFKRLLSIRRDERFYLVYSGSHLYGGSFEDSENYIQELVLIHTS
ncbi:MAG: hypothetical protein M1830_006492 [Pleopsidium flavum]|nr:MAG: hypothetical protein M1830_006492 [Pleopsidium flavum]